MHAHIHVHMFKILALWSSKMIYHISVRILDREKVRTDTVHILSYILDANPFSSNSHPKIKDSTNNLQAERHSISKVT